MNAMDSMVAEPPPYSAPDEADASLPLPGTFIERLVEPLFSDPARALLVAELIGAPLALVAAGRCSGARIEADSLRATAQVTAVTARSTHDRLLELCADLEDAGAPVVAIKGLASGLTLYPRPYLRLLPDADLLFFPQDLELVTRLLRLWGFATLKDAVPVRRWGALTVSSFAPIVPPDRAYYVDVHRFVDDPPASYGLETGDIFMRAVLIDTGKGRLRVPAPEHMFCILALHAFRDFYEPRGLKSLFDAALLVARHGSTLDWGEVERAARTGCFVQRIVFYRELLAELGVATGGMPFPGKRLSFTQRRLLADVVRNFRFLEGFTTADTRKFAFEALLYDSLGETIQWNLARLRGLFSPPSHDLPGVPLV